MARLLISLLLFVSAVAAQPAEQVERIRGFRGLNTRSNEFALKPNDAIVAHNIDWSRALGSITKRYGYDSVSCATNCDSVVGLYGAYYKDGTQQMVYVVDSDSTLYGHVMLSAKGGVAPATVAWEYFSVQQKPSFAMLNDDVYIVNGDQKGVVIDGERNIARSFPIPAPGELSITPYNDTSNSDYYLSGEYRYSYYANIFYNSGSTVSSYYGYISQPVSVPNGRVLIRGFMRPPSDTAYTTDPDSMQIGIYRTLGDAGDLDNSDIFYLMQFSSAITVWTPTTDADTFTYIDSLPDDTLVSQASVTRTVSSMTKGFAGFDSLGVYSGRRLGAPTFIARLDSMEYSTSTNDNANYGVYLGIPSQLDTLGVGYVCTFIDTIMNIESDTGRTLFVWNDSAKGHNSGQMPRGYTIGLPRIPESDSGLIINIYRTALQSITYDTAYWNSVGYLPYALGGILPYYVDHLSVDSIVTGNYYLVAQVPSTDTIYSDSLRYDSLSTKRQYYQSTPPPLLDGVFSYDGRLYGWRGSNLYFSLLDSANAWGAFDYISLNPDDGDEITTAYPTRGVIRAHKNKSTYNIYQDADGDWSRQEISGYYGCVAPYSHAAGPVHYFLSNDNVLGETEGGQLERVYNSQSISAPIDNIDNLSMSSRRDAVGMLWNEHYLLCIGDTTYAWDEKSKGWSTWSLKFSDYTYYGTESATEFIPGDTLYFIKPGDSTIYRYGTAETDNGSSIPIRWKSGPLFIDNIDRYKQITTVGMACNSSDTTNLIYINGRRHDDSLTFHAEFSDLSERYQMVGVPSDISTAGYVSNEGLYYNILMGASVTTPLDDTEIDGIDIWYTTGHRATVK